MYRFKNIMTGNKIHLLSDLMVDDPKTYFNHPNITYWSHVDDETMALDGFWSKDGKSMEELEKELISQITLTNLQ